LTPIEWRLPSVHASQVFAIVQLATDFQRLGASGFVLGAIRTVEAPHAAGLRLRYAAFVEGMREALCGVWFNVMGLLHELLKKERV
jgi:hypothetical protein